MQTALAENMATSDGLTLEVGDDPNHLMLKFGDHSECCKLSHKPESDDFCRVEATSIPCCSTVAHELVIDALVNHINGMHRPGYWMFTKPGPKRKARASSGESCVQPNMEELQPSSSDLRQRLTAAEKEKAPKLSTFQEILRYIDENDKSSLRKETQFALLREKLAGAMRNRKASPLQKTEPGKALIDCIFEFHSNDTHNLHDQLDKSAEQIVDSGKKILTKAAWKMRVTASTASLVARLTKSRYTKTGDKTKEQYIRHNEKLPQILYRVIDELVPAYGVRAFAFFAAIHKTGCLYSRDTKDLPKSSIPALATSIAERVKDTNLSLTDMSSNVDFTLPLVCWVHGVDFSYVCQRLGLKRLARLGLDLTARFDAVLESWRALDWRQVSESERTATVYEFEKRLLFSFQDLDDATNVNPNSEIVIDGLDDLSPRGSETELTTLGAELDELDDSSTRQSETGFAGGISTIEARLSNANTALSNNQCNDFPASSSIDSGYRSNPRSQQMHGTAGASPSAASLPTARPSHQNGTPDPVVAVTEIEESGERASSSTGQKRPHAGDNASAKRPRPDAESIMENSTGVEITRPNSSPPPLALLQDVSLLPDQHSGRPESENHNQIEIDTTSAIEQGAFLATLDMDSVSNWGQVELEQPNPMGMDVDQADYQDEWWNCPIDEMTHDQFAELLRSPVTEQIFIQ